LLMIGGFALLRSKADPDLARRIEAVMETPQEPPAAPVPFDPNTADFDELLRLGLTKSEAVALLHFRAAGKTFRIPEDVALCRGVSDSAFRRIRPFIRIGRQFAFTPARQSARQRTAPPQPLSPFRIDTVSARYLCATGVLSPRQAETFIRWRDSHPLLDLDDVRRSYVVGDSLADILAPYLLFPAPARSAPSLPLDINSADSVALLALRGIGPATAGRIVAYRRRLGGFVRAEQLAEIPGIAESRYEEISQQIRCDSCNIRKIHINFAPRERLRNHPYFDRDVLRKLLKARQLKGGWSTAEEFGQARILDSETTARLIPYLDFGCPSGSDIRHNPASGGDPQSTTRCGSTGELQVPAPKNHGVDSTFSIFLKLKRISL
ncbi:MAG: helix-hairpin-helix domain-containing protein, partial [Alistipes sp.]|nr:helix-hairpin-helix domain-containing protein [Alistipes sp.]